MRVADFALRLAEESVLNLHLFVDYQTIIVSFKNNFYRKRLRENYVFEHNVMFFLRFVEAKPVDLIVEIPVSLSSKLKENDKIIRLSLEYPFSIRQIRT